VTTVRVVIPLHLRRLAGVDGDVMVRLESGQPGHPTIAGLLDALEAEHPALRGTIRDHTSGQRRPHIRYFAAGGDVSHDPVNSPLPSAVVSGREPFTILGAISGG
jgi:sulfur-carrier protein